MAHKTLVGGTAYEVTGGKCLVSGTAYSIKKGRTLVGGTGYDVLFSSGRPLNELSVGDSVFIRVNGTLTEFIIVHKGNPSTSMYDSSCNGVWVLMKDLYTTGAFNSSGSASYDQSAVHTYLNGTFLGLIDAAAQAAIKQVKIPYVSKSTDTSLYNKSNGVSAKVFLLGAVETGCSTRPYTDDYYEVGSAFPITDGANLSYFTSGSTNAANTKRVGYYNGAKTRWWTRSVWNQGSTARQTLINTSGESEGSSLTSSAGYRPALILDNNAIIDPETSELLGL